jgi:phage gp36-like protein
MTYCTPADVRLVLSPDGLQTDDETAAGFSDSALDDAITRAGATLDARLGVAYTVPVDTAANDPGGILRDWCSVVAAYYATLTFSRGADIAPDDPIRLRYAEVSKLLDGIGKGVTVLPFPEPTTGSSSVTVVNRYEGDLFRPDDFDLADSRRPYGWGVIPGWGQW